MPRKPKTSEIKIHSRQIEMRAIIDLLPYAKNARTHSAEQIAALTKIIADSGFTNPCLIEPNGTLIAGHGRVQAAHELGITELPCVIVSGLSKAQIKALRISDNQTGLLSGWNIEALTEEIKSLKDISFDMNLLAFDMSALDEMLATGTAGRTDPDEEQELPAEPISILGDIWLLGDHRIACGDSTSAENVAALLAGDKPHLMVTDPPYGVEYDANWRNEADRANGKSYGASAVGRVENDDRSDWTDAYKLFPGDVGYCWHPAGANSIDFFHNLESAGFEIRMQIIWNKSNFPIGRGHYHVKHEPCWYFVRKGKTAHWNGDRKQTTVWDIAKPSKSETGHSTQKPVECMKRPIENNSKPGDMVYEPFSGSGTTIIAGEMTGRKVIAMELNPAYVDVAVMRWEGFTGRQARLGGINGPTFAEVSLQRIPEAAE